MDDATEPTLTSKTCTGCAVLKRLDEFSFDKRHADGRQSRCKACFREYKKRYREADREHHIELRRLSYERNKIQIREKQRAYVAANRELIAQRAKERAASLAPEDAERFRNRRRQASAAYRRRNPQACTDRINAWRKANPDKSADILHRRRARIKGNGDSEAFTRTEIAERDNWICGICTKPIDHMKHWPDQMSASLDHIKPLAHGGSHSRTNSRISHWICNVRRGAGRLAPST